MNDISMSQGGMTYNFSVDSKNGKFSDSLNFLKLIPGEVHAILRVDCINGETQYLMLCSDISESITNKIISTNHFFEDLERNVERIVYKPDIPNVLANINRNKIRDELTYSKVFSFDFRMLVKGSVMWERMKMFYEQEKTLLVVVYNIDDEIRYENRQQRRVDAIMKAVTKNFICLLEVDLNTETERRYVVDDVLDDVKEDVWGKRQDYSSCIAAYAENVVAPEDRSRFISATNLETIKLYLSENDSFVIEYNALIDDVVRRFQGTFTLDKMNPSYPTMFVGIQDITEIEAMRMEEERKQALYREELMEARKLADAANESKSRFLFNMSHDIRTPMNAIIGFTDMAQKHIEDKKIVEDCLSKIALSNTYLLRLLNDVLDMSRIESDMLSINNSGASISEHFHDINAVFYNEMAKKDIVFITDMDIKNDYVMMDTVRVRQIITNILSNSVKYTENGGRIWYTIKEEPSPRAGCARYRFTIRDTGIGMSEEYLAHIFEQFSREKTVSENRIQGYGLGMAIVKRIVDLMNGNVYVESKKGEGTLVTVLLDLEVGTQGYEPFRQKEEYNFENVAGMKVLVVEDNDLNSEILLSILDENKVYADHATNGKEALQMLERSRNGWYDAVLMDIQMPVMNGYEATENIRKLNDTLKASVPIIAMTANAYEEDKKKAFDIGMNDYISKPISINDMLSKLAQFRRTY